MPSTKQVKSQLASLNDLWGGDLLESIDRTFELNQPDAEVVLEQKQRETLLNRKRVAVYRMKNPEMVSMRARVRSSNSRGATGELCRADIQLQLKSQAERCWWCGDDLNGVYHVDHRIALVKGGSNTPGNIVISCPACNLSKSDRTPGEFMGRLL